MVDRCTSSCSPLIRVTRTMTWKLPHKKIIVRPEVIMNAWNIISVCACSDNYSASLTHNWDIVVLAHRQNFLCFFGRCRFRTENV